ncbi:unnamed protein product [Pseudo-nitzschia multistriata]|uniref:Sulfatase N-terminal domain-containing protein n=1 Tax=Pseudo-nitzschia multistriata TaxID=183589 RepID=A0A448YUQ2_9STRA|nr:unnamed protein product [Pseudo-nitzschia multistriata]
MVLFLLLCTAITVTVVANSYIDEVDSSSSSRTRPLNEGGIDATPKNIILFMTDDQDVTANSIDPSIMPKLNRLFREGGMEFSNYYVSTGLCCPSRATILRGQYCHNTEVFDNGDMNNSTYQSGGWSKFLDTGLENETIATLLQSAGYETAMVGKYMNGYNVYDEKAGLHKPPGWDHWMGLLKCFNFYGPIFSDNGERILKTNKTVYQTDFIRDWVLDFLTKKRDSSKPFFLMVTPFAPHTPSTPAKRHEHLFSDAIFPRYDSFNPSDDVQQQRPAWIKDIPPLTQEQIDGMDNFYRNRLRSLQAVDEALESITETLEFLGLTDDTFFIYTSDNGQHFGDHRIPAGKRQAYETDVLVPFLIRGPGIQKGSKSSQIVQSVDLGPTFLDVATRSNQYNKRSKGKILKSTYPMDGKSIMPIMTANSLGTSEVNDFRWAALLEMYSGSSNIGERYKDIKGYYQNHMYPNTYQAVRVIHGPADWARGANLLYVEWCTGEQELYNMTVDPHQIHNLATSNDPDDIIPLLDKLNRVVATLGNCKGTECYELRGQHIHALLEDNFNDTSGLKRILKKGAMQSSIRKRIPCHDPIKATGDKRNDMNLGRKSFAYDLYVPEPFVYGFPFSDGDNLSEELLQIWNEHEHYFH